MAHGTIERIQPYFSQPNVKKTAAKRFDDLQRYTGELFEGDPELAAQISFTVVFPPLSWDGVFVKGLCYTQGADFLAKFYPFLSDLFYVVADSQSPALPWAQSADGAFTHYSLPARTRWFAQAQPDLAEERTFLPFSSAQRVNDRLYVPDSNISRDIEVLCVAPLREEKNLPLLAEGIRAFQKKYRRKTRLTLITDAVLDLQMSALKESERGEMKKLYDLLGFPFDTIEFHTGLIGESTPASLYQRAQVVVVGSLLDTQLHTAYQAMACNTPVIYFDALNAPIRGNESALPTGGALAIDTVSPEALALGLYRVLTGRQSFQPREAVLQQGGVRWFLRQMMAAFADHYQAIPQFDPETLFTNLWIDLAMQQHYQTSLFDFAYGRTPQWSELRGLSAVHRALKGYYQRFQAHCHVKKDFLERVTP
jgi:glycosyltransferase involved in cell wall biosynthesis